MTKSKNTKRALLASVLSMILCLAMLVGSTFAWFTDSVTSGKNKIVAGNLDVELYNVKDGKEIPVTADTNLFLEDALWEPGHVEVVNLKVANVGTLALTYKLGINVVSEQRSINVNGEKFKLSDYIKFALIDGNQNYGEGDEGRAAAIAAAEANSVKLSELAVDENGVLYPTAKATAEIPASRYVTLVVYMPTDVDNKANYRAGEAKPTIELGINLIATQTPYEKDSFGNNYDDLAKEDMVTGTNEWFDKDAYDTTEAYSVANAADLLALQNAVATGYDFSGKTVTMSGNVDLSAYENWTPIGSKDKPFAGTFDGAGNKISGLKITKDALGFAGLFGVIDGATIKDLTVDGNITITTNVEADALKVGGIAGAAYKKDTTITDCTNNVVIDVSNAIIAEGGAVSVGGIIGDAEFGQGTAKLTITRCTNNADLTASEEILSIVGGMTSTAYMGSYNFEGSVNNGNLTGMAAGTYLNGLVGMN